jgi:hypothetical protein
MTRELRKAIISISMIVTLAVSTIVATPIVNRYAQARVTEVAKTAKPGTVASSLFTAAVYPTVFTAFACLGLSLVVGFIVAKKLPPADPIAKRSRHR